MTDPKKAKAGKAGRAASPWGRFPHCETSKAKQMFTPERHAKMIAEAKERAKRLKAGEDV